MIKPTFALCRPLGVCPAQRVGPSDDVGITRWLAAIVSFSSARGGVTMAGATSRVSRVLVMGPLAPFAEAYRRELRERGYTERSAVSQLRQVARFSRWLPAAGEPVPAASPAEVLLAGFGRYLAAERGLAAGTVGGYVSHARRFLDGLPAGAGLAGVCAKDVTEAVLCQSAAVSVSATQFFVAGLRSFLRFCFIEGQMPVDLSQAALPVTGRRRSPLPRGITKPDARALLDGCDRRSALGRRDYAMLMTLLRLGLRASEVARLRLDDIDWRAGELVVRGKGAREDRLPVPAEVGQAIACYLRLGRPASGRREAFLQARAPFGPIAPGTVSSTVRRACRRAGVAEVGAHRLRHTVACEMVAAGVPLAEIAQVLRHHSLQTTALYGRVDLERLRALAAPWPGSVQR